MQSLKILFIVGGVASVLYALTKSGRDQATFVMVGVIDFILAGSVA